jgi:hypothetical protein
MSNSVLADFRTKLADDSTLFNLVNGRICELPVQDDEPTPWLGFRRTGETGDGEDLSAGAWLVNTSLEVKIRGTPEVTDEIARQVKSYRGYRGAMGDRTVSYIGVDDADNNEDTNDPPGSDETEATTVLRVEIIHQGP